MNEKSPMERDLAALRKLSAQEMPDLDALVSKLRRRGPREAPAPWYTRRNLMALLHSVRTRPALAAAVFGALAALVAMIVPVSYDRVTGQDVALTVAGKGMGSEEAATLARGLKSALGAHAVMVEPVAGNAGAAYVLHAALPRRSGAEARHATAEFARELASKGYGASVRVTPHREHVQSPAVAYALDQIIQISVDGKSAAALEAEIRDRLAQAGVPDAQVSVTDRADGGREVRMTVERQADGTAPPPEPVPQVVLTKDGAPLTGGEGFRVKVQKRKQDGAVTLIVEVDSNGKAGKAEVLNSQSMSDAALADAITTQLRQAGIEVKVTVTAGKVSIEPAK